MASTASERRPGLGETLLAVYGITQGFGEVPSSSGVSRIPHAFLRKALSALGRRAKRRMLAG